MGNRLNGIIVVDKPENMSSAKVVAVVKRIFKAKKAGHAGTLDPFATGVLVCCINDATRLAQFFLKDKKKYEAVICLGAESDTQDLTGNIINQCDDIKFSKRELGAVFNKFKGTIEQFPPVYSALKQNGVPLYKLARQGRPVQKPARQITVSNIRILDINLPEIRFEVTCSAGTYIRTICADIGTSLGCGGYLKELNRLESGGFTLQHAVPLSEMEALASAGETPYRVISMSDALMGMPLYVADMDLEEKILYGRQISDKDIPFSYVNGQEGKLKILNKRNKLLAILNYNSICTDYKYCCVFNN
jgi:tRNA pseudouridine55 synthase